MAILTKNERKSIINVQNCMQGVRTVNGTANTYYFQRNLLGDVVAIYDTSGVFGFACGFIGQNGWMQEWKTCSFITFGGRNALKHVVSMVGTETLLRMTLPAFAIGGIGGGIYGRISEFFNPEGSFFGI